MRLDSARSYVNERLSICFAKIILQEVLDAFELYFHIWKLVLSDFPAPVTTLIKY